MRVCCLQGTAVINVDPPVSLLDANAIDSRLQYVPREIYPQVTRVTSANLCGQSVTTGTRSAVFGSCRNRHFEKNYDMTPDRYLASIRWLSEVEHRNKNLQPHQQAIHDLRESERRCRSIEF